MSQIKLMLLGFCKKVICKSGVNNKKDMRLEILSQILANKKYNVDSLMKKMLTTGKLISKYGIENYWLDIGCEEDYLKAQKFFEKNN